MSDDCMRFFEEPILFFRMRSCMDCGIVERNLSEALVELNICQAVCVVDMDTGRGRQVAMAHGIVDSPRLVIGGINLGIGDLMSRDRLFEVLGK